MKKTLATGLLLALCIPFLLAQEFPEPMQPPRLVNDFVKMLNPSDADRLENKLLTFNNETSNQIYIVTVPTLHGYDPNDYTTRLAEKWGVGVKGKDNGVMILIKPKTPEEKGEIYIGVGYGLEGALTDLQANQIVTLDVLPKFKANDYAGGLEIATDAIMKITSGEFTADQYLQRGKPKKGNSLIGLIILAILFSLIFGGKSRSNRHKTMGGSNLPFWLLLGMLGSRGNSGSFGGFSSGGGFGGGGFGGGGGGSFGGGGAGGSW